MASNSNCIEKERAAKLRILFISSDKYPPFRVDSAVLFGEEMIGRGHRVDWILQSEGPCDHAYKATWHGSHILVGPTDTGTTRWRRLRKHVLCIWHQLKLFQILGRDRYDFVQVKNKYVIALASILAAKLFRTRFVYWLSYPHAEESLYKLKEGMARYPVFYFLKGHILTFLMYRIIMPMADHIFVQSEKMKQDIAVNGVDLRKMTVVPMGISLREFEPYRSSSSPKPIAMNHCGKSIVYLGTLQRARKMDFMVRVLARVVRKEPGAVLYFVGDGEDDEDRNILEKAAADLNISDSLVITGFLPRSDAMVYVHEADVCVSPFCPSPILDSTSPTKLIEYMAMEKAVVANDHPEQRRVLEESGGGICVPYDEEEFSIAILKILADPDKAREMGVRGRHYVEKYRDYMKIADFLENRYLQICAGWSGIPESR